MTGLGIPGDRDFTDHSGKVLLWSPWELYTEEQLKRLKGHQGGIFLEDRMKELGLLSRETKANW